jgi:hypothetical protein
MLHSLLDVTFNEEHWPLWKEHAPENMAALRRVTLNLLRQERSHTISLRQKGRICSLDEGYLLIVVLSTRPLSRQSRTTASIRLATISQVQRSRNFARAFSLGILRKSLLFRGEILKFEHKTQSPIASPYLARTC